MARNSKIYYIGYPIGHTKKGVKVYLTTKRVFLKRDRIDRNRIDRIKTYKPTDTSMRRLSNVLIGIRVNPQ